MACNIYRYANQFGKIPGVLGRSGFGIEIVVALAYQVYCLGLSMDRSWESEFESLCALLANSAVVYCDETSWSINSVWAFLTEQITVVFYGVHKDGATLQSIIDKSKFEGVLLSDSPLSTTRLSKNNLLVERSPLR